MITTRALNRATLHRQMLLDRVDLPVTAAVEHLVGLQAQEPPAPYFGLWSRLLDFRPEHLATLLDSRDAVRAPLHRATIHLVTAADHSRLEPVLRPMVQRRFRSSPFRHILGGPREQDIIDTARKLAEEKPRTRAEFTRLLSERWPDLDSTSLGYLPAYLLPVVQVPPRGVWGRSGPAAWTTADAWLGGTRAEPSSPQDVIRRYLAAFGPATVKDVQTWSGLTRLKDVVAGMDLRVLRDEQGRELLDVPDAALPDADTPAPPRFLPEFDNLLLGHADRTRVISDEDYARGVVVGGKATLLVDGVVHGTWRLDAGGVAIEVFRPLTAAQRDDVTAEALRLLEFAGIDGGDVRL